MMKKGINQWAFSPDLSLKKIFKIAHDAGFDGIELNLEKSNDTQNVINAEQEITSITMDSERDDLEMIVGLAKQYQLELPSVSTALLWDTSLTANESGEQEMAKKIVRKMIDVASILGADTVLVVPGAVDIPWKPNFNPVPYEQAYHRSFEALKELKHYAEEKEITIALENVWNKFLLSPLEMRDFVDALESKFIGIYFDVGNVLLTGYPEDWIGILGSRIKRIHLKDFRKVLSGQGIMVNLLEGNVNWNNVIAALREINYESYLTAEIFPYKFHNERLIYETAHSIEAILTV